MENRISRRPAQGAVSALLCVLAALFCTCALAAGPTKRFDIAAGNALTTLDEFASQSSLYILYVTDAVKEIETNAVSGDLSVDDAVKQLLAGTRLSAHFESDYSLVSIKVSEPSATVGQAANNLSTRDVNRGLPELQARALASEMKLAEVTVTGTLMHDVVDIVSPLTFITRSDMKKTAYATVQDALQALSVNQAGNFGEIFSGVGNFARGVAANLRGLGSGATLVLVDGERQPYSGALGDFVDLSNIAWSAVERIEVLPDGASALYGSDAVAGVVNVITRKDISHAETQLRLGTTPSGGEEKLFSQLVGTHWDSGNVLFSYQYSERDALAARERAYAANDDKRALGGTDHRLPQSSPGNILNPDTFRPEFGIPSGQNGSALTASDLLVGQINLINMSESVDMLADRTMHNLFLNGSQELSDDLQLFAEAHYTTRHVSQSLYGRNLVLVVPPSNPFYVNPYPSTPFTAVAYNLINDLGLSYQEVAVNNFGGTVGTKAKLNDAWRLNVSGSYGRETMRADNYNQVNFDALNAALADPESSTAFNPFGDGGDNNSETLDAIRETQVDRAISTVTSGRLVADGPLFDLSAGAVKLAVGGEWRQEAFSRGRSMQAFDRHVQSVFAELSIPLVGDASNTRATPRFELSLAGRHERYSDFGSTSNPKVGLRWAPSSQFKLRTTWGTSFRAPKLVDVYDTSMDAAAIFPLPDPKSPTGSSLVLARAGSNKDLHEETASTWTAGIDIAPAFADQLTISLTYYQINYKGRILVPSADDQQGILVNENIWADAIIRNPSHAQISAICDGPVFGVPLGECGNAPITAIVDYRERNMGSTRVSGLDLKINQVLDTDVGKFDLGVDGSYIFAFEQTASSSAPEQNILNTVGNPLALRSRATVDWHQRDWNEPGVGISASLTHIGAYKYSDTSDIRVRAFNSLDARWSYRTAGGSGAWDDLEFALNASNLLNSTPPFVDRYYGFDTLNAQPYGRVVSFSLQKNW